MKKVIMTIAIAFTVLACGTKATNDKAVDSAAVALDTLVVSEVPADTLK
jgi:predicted secreted protein